MQLAGDDARDVEQILDERASARARCVRCWRGARRSSAGSARRGAQDLDPAEDGVERRPQLVRERGEELVLQRGWPRAAARRAARPPTDHAVERLNQLADFVAPWPRRAQRVVALLRNRRGRGRERERSDLKSARWSPAPTAGRAATTPSSNAASAATVCAARRAPELIEVALEVAACRSRSRAETIRRRDHDAIGEHARGRPAAAPPRDSVTPSPPRCSSRRACPSSS